MIAIFGTDMHLDILSFLVKVCRDEVSLKTSCLWCGLTAAKVGYIWSV